MRVSISRAEKPASRRIAALCSPRRGGYCRIDGGVLLQVAAGPANRSVPSVGWSIDCNRPTAVRCGSSIKLSRSCSGAYGMSACSNRRLIDCGIVRARIAWQGQSDVYRAADSPLIAKNPQITLNFRLNARCLFRIVGELYGWPAIDRGHLANDRDRIEIHRTIRRASHEIIRQIGAPAKAYPDAPGKMPVRILD